MSGKPDSLRPPEHLCHECLGTGYTIAWCKECAKSFEPIDHYQHRSESINGSRRCHGCGGSGRLIDLIRRRVMGEVPEDLRGRFRWEAKRKLAHTFQTHIDKITAATILGISEKCSKSLVDSSTSSLSTSKQRGGKTTR